jgi:hypothetical protein
MAVHTLHLLLVPLGKSAGAAEKIDKPPKHRGQHNGNDPGNFVAGITLFVDDIKHHKKRNRGAKQIDGNKVI